MTQNTSGRDTELKEVGPGIYAYIQSPGTWMVSNAGLVTGERYNHIVDTLVNEEMISDFIAMIERVTHQPARFLINTHHHSDHIWTNHYFPESIVICQSFCREATLEDQAIDPKMYEMVFPELNFNGAKVTPQDVTFDKEMCLYDNGRRIRLVHSGPAHTKGDIFVHLADEGVVFCGDLLFYRCTPFALMGYISGWIDTLNVLLDLDASVYVPGHGPVAGRDGVQECRDYFVFLRDEARNYYNSGYDSYEASMRIDLGPWKDWGEPERVVVNLERLYSEFRGEEPAAPLDAMKLFSQMKMWQNEGIDK